MLKASALPAHSLAVSRCLTPRTSPRLLARCDEENRALCLIQLARARATASSAASRSRRRTSRRRISPEAAPTRQSSPLEDRVECASGRERRSMRPSRSARKFTYASRRAPSSPHARNSRAGLGARAIAERRSGDGDYRGVLLVKLRAAPQKTERKPHGLRTTGATASSGVQSGGGTDIRESEP